MEKIHTAPCPEQHGGLAAHPLCLMPSAVESAAWRQGLRRPITYTTVSVGAGDSPASSSILLSKGQHAPNYTHRKRSS